MHFDLTASEGARISTDGVVCEAIEKRVARAFGYEGLREFGQQQFNIHRMPGDRGEAARFGNAVANRAGVLHQMLLEIRALPSGPSKRLWRAIEDRQIRSMLVFGKKPVHGS